LLHDQDLLLLELLMPLERKPLVDNKLLAQPV
jgi:hypothetical protein